MKIFKLVLVLIFTLVACTPSEDKIQQMIAETKMAQDTITVNSTLQAPTEVKVTEAQLSTITPSLTPSHPPTQSSTPILETIVEESTDVSQNEMYFPDALAIRYLDFQDIDLIYKEDVLLSLPCLVFKMETVVTVEPYSEDSKMFCIWPGQDYLYHVNLNDQRGGKGSFSEEDVIMLVGTYEGLTTILPTDLSEQEKVHTIKGIYYETDMTEYAYEPATTDLTSSIEDMETYDGDSLVEIPTNVIRFPIEFEGLYIKLPCVVSEVVSDNFIFCIWKDAEEEYSVSTDNSSFAGLQSTDKLTIYGFLHNTYTSFYNTLNERFAVEDLLLSSYVED